MLGPWIVVAGLVSSGAIHVDHFRWEGRLAAGQSIEIKNVYGSIHAEAAAGDMAEVVALREGEIEPVQVGVVRAGDGIVFRALPSESGLSNSRVNFLVRVPRGVRFVGRTVNGSVEADSLHGDTAVYTVNGDVRLSTTGEGQAETVNGSITASLGRTRGRSHLKFSAVNGGITLRLPRCFNAKLHASTNHGAIHADFPVELEPHAAGSMASSTLGRGGPQLTLITINGNIELLRSAGTRL